MKIPRRLLYLPVVRLPGRRGGCSRLPHRESFDGRHARLDGRGGLGGRCAPGLIARRAWPIALVLLPLGAYLVARVQLPLPSTVHGLGSKLAGFYLDQLRSGAHAYAANKFPLELDGAPDLKLFLSTCTYGATGLAALVALSFRKATPAIVVVLALLGFGLTVDNTTRVIWLPFAFVVAAGCTLMLSRSLLRRRWKLIDALTGGATVVIATLLAFSVLGTTSVSASKPWGDWRSWGAAGAGIAHISFDWMASFPTLLDPHTNVPVMKVTSAEASYWRANALGSFTGTRWTSGSSFGQPLRARFCLRGLQLHRPHRRAHARRQDSHRGVRRRRARHQIPLHRGHAHPPAHEHTGVCLHQRGRSAEAGASARAQVPLHGHLDHPADQGRGPCRLGRRLHDGDDALQGPAFPDGGRDDRTATRRRVGGTRDLHAADREWLGLYELNRSIVGTASDPYEIALRIERFLRSHYTYSRKPPRNGCKSQYAAFLFETKTGHCAYFAGAMAVLLRFNDIPARVALGFTCGRRQADGTFLVSTNDTHAWVEAYFPQAGWVPFEPTPGNALPMPEASSTTPRFVDPYASATTSPTSPPTRTPPTQADQTRPEDPVRAPSGAQRHPAASAGWSGSCCRLRRCCSGRPAGPPSGDEA